ncbi:MFS transporter [Paenibacillus alkalitolerans]|uniref:MFS transporter n=1 Tax=Paenibacillus alkalitolerans TaxID=2799335 RepID=UPI0018F4D88A|nr:MFS transporter [Paenibacillus alkalitolerans]
MRNQAMRKSGSQPPLQTRFFYGWLIVFIGGVGVFFSGPGQTYSNSVFIASYIQEFSLNQTAISSIYSAATLASGLLLFFMGRLVDRFGRRIMLALAAMMLGAACFFNSFVTGPVMLFFGFFMVRYFGQGSMTLIPNTLVSQWFFKYRGRALGFAGLGGLLGAATFPPLINWLIEAYGWQNAWRVLGTALFIFVPIAYYFVRNQPEDAGLLPDGMKAETGRPDDEHAPSLEDSWTLSEALRTRAFWFVMICGAIPAMINTGIIFLIFPILSDQGIDRVTTAFVLSLIPLVSFGCSLLSGFIVERVKAHRMLSVTFAMNMVVPVILIFAHSHAAVIVFAVAWGISQGFMNVPLGVIWPNYYGRKYLGSIQGVTHTAGVIGSALGPVQFGWAYDRFGNYTGVLIFSALIWAGGAVLAFVAKPPRRKRGLS